METQQIQEAYYDPFASAGEELFNPQEAFEQLKEQYESGNVEHDYSADRFVADTEALILEAHFIERFDAVQAIASQMHQMCNDDHGLSSLLGQSSVSSLFSGGHNKDDGHGHGAELHDHDIDDDDDTIEKKKRKKR